jgi:hypothetical protein
MTELDKQIAVVAQEDPTAKRLQQLRGDAYLRCLLVHGARAAVRTAKDKDVRLSRWIINLQARRHNNVVAVALANKMARMAWAMMTQGVDYDPDLAALSVS